MIKPNDITLDNWEHLPADLKMAFSLNFNRSFVTPIAEDIHGELKRCAVINHKINSAGNLLRSLQIESIKNSNLKHVDGMEKCQKDIFAANKNIQIEIIELQKSLLALKTAILDRINFYKETVIADGNI
jgi:hypothetical protein